MITKYTIKNFRVFDENGASFDLKPLTILTGCNSSGKSSIVKSLLLLCDYLSSLKEDKKNGKKPILTSHELDFMKKPHSKLGRFKKIVNNYGHAYYELGLNEYNNKLFLYNNSVVIDFEGNDIYLCDCEYVHELQHVLKSCKIEKYVLL